MIYDRFLILCLIKSMSENVFMFMMGSSVLMALPPMLYISYMYDGMSNQCLQSLQLSIPQIITITPLILGAVFSGAYYTFELVGVPRKVQGIYLRFLVSAGLSGFILSTFYDYVGLYETYCLDFDANQTHIGISLAYIILFHFAGIWMYRQICDYFYDDSPAPSTSTTSTPINNTPISTATNAVPPSSTKIPTPASSTPVTNYSNTMYDQIAQLANLKK
jgi:hypothetical protein